MLYTRRIRHIYGSTVRVNDVPRESRVIKKSRGFPLITPGNDHNRPENERDAQVRVETSI